MSRKLAIPRTYYPCSTFVSPDDLDRFPSDTYLQVDTASICSRIHALRGIEQKGNARFWKLFDVLSHILYGQPNEDEIRNGIDGVRIVESLRYFGGFTIQMKVSDIDLFMDGYLGPTSLKLTEEQRKIARKREDRRTYLKNFVLLGTVDELMKKLKSYPKDRNVFFNGNTNKVVIKKKGEKK